MYRISKFFKSLLKTVFRISLILSLLMILYAVFHLTIGSNDVTESTDFIIVEKFSEDKGFILFDKSVRTNGQDSKIRVDYVTMNDFKTNVLKVSEVEFDRLEVGKRYTGRFHNGNFKYIDFVNDENKDIKNEEVQDEGNIENEDSNE